MIKNRSISYFILPFIIFIGLSLPAMANTESRDAKKIVLDAINHWRGTSSFAEAEMIIHRPKWERRMSIVSQTKGTDSSLVRFTAPPKDAGSATLSIAEETWSYSPRVNRIIKIPASMKAQSWMGSDFSYRDLTKSDDIVESYNHTLLKTQTDNGQKTYIVESVPKESAAVVWGREVLSIREDNIIMRHEFYDQSDKLVKVLTARDVQVMDGKIYPRIVRIEKVEVPEEWTEIVHNKIQFGVEIPDSVFTQTNLSNPR